MMDLEAAHLASQRTASFLQLDPELMPGESLAGDGKVDPRRSPMCLTPSETSRSSRRVDATQGLLGPCLLQYSGRDACSPFFPARVFRGKWLPLVPACI